MGIGERLRARLGERLLCWAAAWLKTCKRTRIHASTVPSRSKSNDLMTLTTTVSSNSGRNYLLYTLSTVHSVLGRGRGKGEGGRVRLVVEVGSVCCFSLASVSQCQLLVVTFPTLSLP